MTVNDIVYDMYQSLGEPTDLDPSSVSGLATMLRAVNQSIERVASWKDPITGRFLRVPELRGEYTFQVEKPTGTWGIALPTEGAFEFTAPAELALYAEGNIIVLDGTSMYCYFASGTSVYTKDAVPAGLEDGFTWEVYRKNVFVGKVTGETPNDIDVIGDTANQVPGKFIDVMRLWDLTSSTPLSRGPKGSDYLDASYTVGQPALWTKLGNVIFFDTHLIEDKWFKMEYYKIPKQVTTLAETPELPENLHYAVLLAGLEWGYMRSGETTEKYSIKQDLKEFFRSFKSTQDMYEDQYDQDGGQLVL